MKLFWFILILTIILRFYRLEQFAGFSWDQEQLLAYPVKNIIQGKLTLIGPQTGPGGIFLGPLLYYLAVPFFWILNLHPVAGSVLASTLGITASLLVYLIFARFFKPALALFAFAVYATSPLFNLNDRTIWNPSLIPIVSLGVLYVYLDWLKSRQLTYFNLAALATSTALGIQAHLGFLFTLPLHLLIFLQTKPSLNLKLLLWGILIFVLWFTPLILFDLRHQGINSQTAISFFFVSQKFFSSLSLTSRFFHLLYSSFQLIGSVLISSHHPSLNFIVGLLLIITFNLIAWSKLQLHLFWTWLLVFVLGFSFYRGNVPDYYLWPILIVTLIPLVIIFDYLVTRFKFPPQILTFILIFFLTFTSLDRLSDAPADSLHHKLQTVRYIIGRAETKPFRLVYDTDFGRYYGFGYIFDYYKIIPSVNPQDPAFTVVIPEFFRTGQHSDVAFGSIGIINPKEVSK